MLESNTKEGLKLYPQCRRAVLYTLCGGDLADPPSNIGSSAFLQALTVSNIPEAVRTIASSEIINLTKEASAAWKETKLKHQERNERLPLVDLPINSKTFVVDYLDEHTGFDLAMAQTVRFKYAAKVVGDGNCFYRAFLYSLILYFTKTGAQGPTMQHRKLISDMLHEESDFYGHHLVMDIGLDLIKFSLEYAPLLPMEFWHLLINRHRTSDAMVYALRGIIAMGADHPEHRAFITEDFDEYVQKYIYSMGSWGGQIEATVAAKMFCVSMTITDLQNGRRIVANDVHSANEDANIELIYNGVHYDLFYLH